ncbi:MAG TPA: cytochrome C oxidase subunit IV family protein [Bryobacteraceae bacterium]|jgi:cytochrome c oxidase subunit 4|nr:cytochrome C oxidase subunit IV family protein [Bryobacteraceae bacterium]
MISHVPRVRTLVFVFLALIVLTGATTAIDYINLGDWNVVVALAIAVIKASLVAWIFMGVRHVTSLNRLFVIAGITWLSFLFLLTFADYTTRSWQYQPQAWGH